MAIEADRLRLVVVVAVLLHVQALVGVVALAVFAVDGETVKAVVGVLDLHDVTIVFDVLISLDDSAVRLSLDRNVGILTPVNVFRMLLGCPGCQQGDLVVIHKRMVGSCTHHTRHESTRQNTNANLRKISWEDNMLFVRLHRADRAQSCVRPKTRASSKQHTRQFW